LLCFGSGTNVVPTIHIKDLAAYVVQESTFVYSDELLYKSCKFRHEL